MTSPFLKLVDTSLQKMFENSLVFINHVYFFHDCQFLFVLHFSKNV